MLCIRRSQSVISTESMLASPTSPHEIVETQCLRLHHRHALRLPTPIAIFSSFQGKKSPNPHPRQKKSLYLPQLLTRANPARGRMEKADTRGIVYQRSQTGRLRKEKSWVEARARAENGKCVVLRCIGICKQVGKAAAQR